MKKFFLFVFCCGLLLGTGCTKIAVSPESEVMISNWTLAREYQDQGRFELAKEHYLLALASARTQEVQQTLQREIHVVDRMLDAMR